MYYFPGRRMIATRPATRHWLIVKLSGGEYVLKQLYFRLRGDRYMSMFEVNGG